MPSRFATCERFMQSTGDKLIHKEFDAWLGDKPLDTLALLDWRKHVDQRWPAPASKNRAMSSVRCLLHWARLSKICTLSRDDISDCLKAWPVPASIPKRLDSEQVVTLISAALKYQRAQAVHLRRYILLALTMGARVDELVQLEGTAFDVINQEVKVFASKTRRERRVPMRWSITLKEIAPMVSTKGKLFKFTGPRGCPNPVQWNNMLAGTGLKVTLRELRATCASFVASSGKVPQAWLSSWFGHGDAVAFKYYHNPIQNVTGEVVEDWYGCPDLMRKLLNVVKKELCLEELAAQVSANT